MDCVKVFFNRKFHFSAEEHEDTAPSFDDLNFDDENNLDRKVAASGFDSKRKEEFERLSVALTVPEEDAATAGAATLTYDARDSFPEETR